MNTFEKRGKEHILQNFLLLALPMLLILGTTAACEGPQGPQGDDGANGQDGENGSQIHSGTGAPAASLGVIGDYYLDKSNYQLYGPKTGGGWGSSISLKGTAM